MWDHLGGTYGFIHPASDHSEALAHASGIVSSPWELAAANEIAPEAQRIEQYQTRRDEIGGVMFFAYWGNFRGASLTRKLGGVERVNVKRRLTRSRSFPLAAYTVKRPHQCVT